MEREFNPLVDKLTEAELDEVEEAMTGRKITRPTADLGDNGEQSTAEEDAEWLRRVARGQNAMVRYTHMHPKALSNIDRIADRLILYREALESALAFFGELADDEPHDVVEVNIEAIEAKIASLSALLSKSGDD